jgi:sugar lactone lactonase YvrE
MVTWAGILCGVLLALFPALSFGGEAVRLRHLYSIYLDEKGGGLKRPEGIACAEKAQIVVGDTGNGRLVRYALEEKGAKPTGEMRAPQLSSPIRVQVSSKGETFALDGKQQRIARFGPGGEFRGFVNSEGVPAPATVVPRSFRLDANDNIHILDIFAARLVILSPDGKFQRQVAYPPDAGFLSDLAVDRAGAIFAVDSVKARVYAAAKDATGLSPLTKNLREYLRFPTSLALDAAGTIYLVDENGGGVVILRRDGSYAGRQLNLGWTEGLLYYPSQMCVTDRGEAVLADQGNSRVQVFSIVK